MPFDVNFDDVYYAPSEKSVVVIFEAADFDLLHGLESDNAACSSLILDSPKNLSFITFMFLVDGSKMCTSGSRLLRRSSAV